MIAAVSRQIILTAMLLQTVVAGAANLRPQSPPPALEQQTPQQVEAPVQPLPFSHKKHATIQVPCEYCHTKPGDGVRMTFPQTSKCMMCHTSIGTDKPAIQKLIEFHQSQKPVPWVQVYNIPGFVFWSHATHLGAAVSCSSCHGDVANMDTMRKVTNVTTMAGCVDCHKKRNVTTGCLACHETQNSLLRAPSSWSRYRRYLTHPV